MFGSDAQERKLWGHRSYWTTVLGRETGRTFLKGNWDHRRELKAAISPSTGWESESGQEGEETAVDSSFYFWSHKNP